jgi:hypothetical protein
MGGTLPPEYRGCLPLSEMGVYVLDELDSGPGPPFVLALPLMVGVKLLRVRSVCVSILVIERVGVTLPILRLAT